MPEYICSSCGQAFEAEPDKGGRIVCTVCGLTMEAASAKQPLPAGARSITLLSSSRSSAETLNSLQICSTFSIWGCT